MSVTAGEIDITTLYWTEPLTLQVRHLTRFIYDGPADYNYNEVRLRPFRDHCQSCQSYQLRVSPSTHIRSFPDFYGNCVDYVDVMTQHTQLDIEALSVVHSHPDDRGAAPDDISPDLLKDPRIQELEYQFLHGSNYVSLDAEIWRREQLDLPCGKTDLWANAVAIGRHVYRTFTYTPLATSVNTHPAEVLETRQGVCQDFAHVMLGMCRIQGIPARYVSGYFFNPKRGPDELEASHAWVEVFLPGFGWKGFDPTHDRVPDTRYVKVAVGRDYADAMPISGRFRGKGGQSMSVEVKVSRLS